MIFELSDAALLAENPPNTPTATARTTMRPNMANLLQARASAAALSGYHTQQDCGRAECDETADALARAPNQFGVTPRPVGTVRAGGGLTCLHTRHRPDPSRRHRSRARR